MFAYNVPEVTNVLRAHLWSDSAGELVNVLGVNSSMHINQKIPMRLSWIRIMCMIDIFGSDTGAPVPLEEFYCLLAHVQQKENTSLVILSRCKRIRTTRN